MFFVKGVRIFSFRAQHNFIGDTIKTVHLNVVFAEREINVVIDDDVINGSSSLYF